MQRRARQQAGRVEVAGEQFLDGGPVRLGQGEAHSHIQAVMNVDLRAARTLGNQFLKLLAMRFLEVNQHAFNVFAGADEICLVIGAGTGILHFVQRADFDAIGPPGDRRFNLEQAEDGMAAFIGNLENLFTRPLAAALDLDLDVGGHGKPPKDLLMGMRMSFANYTCSRNGWFPSLVQFSS